MIRALHILTYINGGGAEAVVYNYYSHIDRSQIQFDIVALKCESKQILAPKFCALGARIYYLPHNPLKRIREIARILSREKYDIVHSHCELLSEWYLLIAAIKGVKVRIMHSHIAGSDLSFAKRIYRPIGRFVAKRTATAFFACGKLAAISLWGRAYFEKGKCYIVNNAIELGDFKFDEKKRDSVRKTLGWDNKHVLVNVGRLNFQKNHGFLLNIFEEYSRADNRAILVLVGAGELEDEIKKKIQSKQLDDKVEMLGIRSDVSTILNGCDCFILPSLFEGLPVVAIESQANGLPIVMADTITRECGVTEIASYVSLEASTSSWSNRITDMLHGCRDRRPYNEIMRTKGYDITIESGKLLNKYKDLLNT